MLKALTRSLCLTIVFALPGAIFAVAQDSTPVLRDQTKDQNDEQSMETLKVRVNVVQLFFNVKDKKGALIPNQTKNDFELLEDGKPQTIKYFTAESNLPLTLGILIDSSGSQMRVLEMEKEAGTEFLQQVLRQKDLAFLINFDVNVELINDFSNSIADLRRGL